jgi:tRNA-modifying protein YgfZ
MIPPAYPLNSLGVLSFAGPEAVAFLQGQVSNDVGRLQTGVGQLTAYSTAQGRVLAIIWLVRTEGEVLGILPQEILEPCLARLKKYVLRAKVTISDAQSRLIVAGCFAAEAGAAAPPTAARIAQDSSRLWVLLDRKSGEPALPAAATPSEFARRWRLADVRAGLPQIYLATQEQFVAQMLNLDLTGGIDFNKGCYTGQEIIARTQHLGRIKRRMYRFRLVGSLPQPGTSLQLDEGRHATVIESAADGEAFECLAVMPISATAADQPAPASIQSLPYRIEAITAR